MNICVFGAARDDVDPGFFALGEAFGRALARGGHTMIFGGGAHGMMGAAARGCAAENGRIISVVPWFFSEPGVLWEQNAELIRMDTLGERKTVMEERADAFAVLPGGIGTLDEFFEVLTMRNLGRHSKPIALLDYDDCWQSAVDLLEKTVERGFAAPGVLGLFRRFTDPEKCLAWFAEEAEK